MCSGGCRDARKKRRDVGDQAELGLGARALKAELARLRELGAVGAGLSRRRDISAD
jgi:hypothetical protein